jgi:hypothetical protein
LGGLPYWEWEVDSVSPLASSIWDKDPSVPMWGDSTPLSASQGGYVDSGLFTKANGWKLIQATGDGTFRDNYLKRRITPKDLSQTVDGVANAIVNNPNFQQFITICHGQLHFSPHTFLFYSMASQASPDEPLFFMHHCNVDRLFALWADCNEYEKKSGGALGCPSEYCEVNPVSGDDKTVYDGTSKAAVNLDTEVTLYYGSSSDSKICPKSIWPKIKDLHSCGDATTPGWAGLYVRYGPDNMAKRIASSCPKQRASLTGNPWTWVNYEVIPKKRDTANFTEELEDNASKAYKEFDIRFAAKMSTGEKSPQDVIKEMAMETCMATPKSEWTQENLAMMRMMGISPSSLDRICDEPSPKLHQNGRPVF